MGQPKYQTDGDPRTSGPGFGVALHPEVLLEPLRWRKPQKVFVDGMADLFHADVEVDDLCFELVDESDEERGDWAELYPNCWGFHPPWDGGYDTYKRFARSSDVITAQLERSLRSPGGRYAMIPP